MSNDDLIENRQVARSTPPPSRQVGTVPLSLNRAELLAGVQAGLGAGLAMSIVAIIVSLSTGLGLWTPFNDVTGTLFPALVAPQAFNLLAAIISIVVHFTLSAVLGAAFAALYAGGIKLTFGFGMPIFVGVGFGLLTWLLARFLGLPLLGSEVYLEPAFLTAHAVFGAVLGLLYPRMPARRS